MKAARSGSAADVTSAPIVGASTGDGRIMKKSKDGYRNQRGHFIFQPRKRPTSIPGEPLDLATIFTLAVFAPQGFGLRGVPGKLPRRAQRFFGPKVTVWNNDPLTGRKVRMGHVRY